MEEEVAEEDNVIEEVEKEPFSRGLVNESEEETEKVDNEKELRVECPQCHKRITRSNLRRHIKRVHEEDEPIRGQNVTTSDQSDAEDDQSEEPEVIPVLESTPDQSEAEEEVLRDQSEAT